MSKKTNSGLVDYAKKMVGLPYWNGTFGQIASEALYKAKKKQLPHMYTAGDFATQYGKRVHDCCGLIKGYLWSETPTSVPKYVAKQDLDAQMMYAASKTKGRYATFPAKPGTLVYKASQAAKPTSIHHVGVYIGGGYVIEAKGHAYGVIKSKMSSSWNYWSQHPDITCDTKAEGSKEETSTSTTTKKSVEEVAKDVIAGKYGNGTARRKALIEAGYNYSEVQAAVNKLMTGSTTSTAQYKTYSVTASVLNIRSGPGTNYKVIGGLRKNTKVRVSSTSNGWAKLYGSAGYVSANYLK